MSRTIIWLNGAFGVGKLASNLTSSETDDCAGTPYSLLVSRLWRSQYEQVNARTLLIVVTQRR
ncbi:hypothetical protein [Nostoc sp.]|uniref:hypothetical protein n=1 Tax=Nostoc sp. TaxID=1180 RepID=UPI002FFD03D6